MLSILVFVLLGNGQVLERNQEQALAGTHPEFSRVTLIQQLSGMREDMVVYVAGRRKPCLAESTLRTASSS